MKKLSIILLIVLAVALYPNGSNETAALVNGPVTTLDLPYVH
ncbi:hypothetical protein SAMN05518871_101121 [Psychrobacillus sp. OK028]|nr:hypothetical protein [Psychrobacillus sp. OK028]SDM39724.1 hypothetical protein SAMN05518871_101121 [Psychrobacillus sp. OK028]